MEGFAYDDDDEYGDFDGDAKAAKAPTTKKPETKPIAKPRSDPEPGERPKRLVRIRKGNSLSPKFMKLLIDDDF